MPRAIFYVFVSLLLVVSCECKDMHVRRMPEEKDIAFKGEVKADPSQKTKTYIPNEQREIKIHLASSDEEAQAAQFKILSATLADGSPVDLDYTSLKLGDNTLHYTPQKPGTHEITLRVAVEGEEGSAQILPCTIEAPAAEWQVAGHADNTGNIALTIANAPEEWRSESWRITNTRWSRGLQGRITGNITQLQAGENTLPITLQQGISLAESPQVHFTLQGPDSTSQSITLDLREVCLARLEETYSEARIQALSNHTEDEDETQLAIIKRVCQTYQGNLTGNDRAEAQRELTRKLEETTRRQAEATTQLAQLVSNLNILRTEDTTDLGVLETRRNALQRALDSLTVSMNTLQPMVTQLNASNTGPIDPYGVLYGALQQGTYDASMAPNFNSPLLSRGVINKRDPSGHTLLHYAIEAEHQEAIALLLGAGAVQDLIADWQLQGDYDPTSQQLVLSIGDAPGRLQQARDPQSQWRITSTTWSQGLSGQIDPNLALQHGENRIPLEINMGTLTEAPTLQVVLQGPDNAFQDITLDLIEVCMAKLRTTETDLTEQTERVNAYVQETDTAYQLPPETVTDPRVNREKQNELTTLLGRLTAFQTQYERDQEAFSSNLETLEQTQVNENLAVFEANNKRLKDAIASLKSAQVQLQQQYTTAHMALFKALENENQEAIDILLEDPKLDINGRDGDDDTLLSATVRKGSIENVRKLLVDRRAAPVNHGTRDGLLTMAVMQENQDMVSLLLENGADIISSKFLCLAAAKVNDTRMMRRLIDHSYNINETDNQGRTALNILSSFYEIFPHAHGIIELLLDSGADQNVANNRGRIPVEQLNFNDPEAQRLKALFMRGDKSFRRRFGIPQVLGPGEKHRTVIQQEQSRRSARLKGEQ